MGLSTRFRHIGAVRVSPNMGAYLDIVARPNREPSIELAFYDGERSIEEATALRDALSVAIEKATKVLKE